MQVCQAARAVRYGGLKKKDKKQLVANSQYAEIWLQP